MSPRRIFYIYSIHINVLFFLFFFRSIVLHRALLLQSQSLLHVGRNTRKRLSRRLKPYNCRHRYTCTHAYRLQVDYSCTTRRARAGTTARDRIAAETLNVITIIIIIIGLRLASNYRDGRVDLMFILHTALVVPT